MQVSDKRHPKPGLYRNGEYLDQPALPINITGTGWTIAGLDMLSGDTPADDAHRWRHR